MFNQPYGGWPPQQPIVFMPPSGDSIDNITKQIEGLERLKKALKEESKNGDKPKKEKEADPRVINIMFLMLLLSPITGPVMFKFFQWGASFAFH